MVIGLIDYLMVFYFIMVWLLMNLRALHGPGGSLNSTAVPSFRVELDCLFTA